MALIQNSNNIFDLFGHELLNECVQESRMSQSYPQPYILNALDELTASIYRRLDLEELEKEYIRLIQPLIPAKTSALYLFSPTKSKPVRITGQGLDIDFLNFYEEDGRQVDPLHQWIRQHYSPNLSHRLLGLNGWQHHPIYRIVGTLNIDYAMQSPIVSGDEVIGTLNFGRPKVDGPFTRAELTTASILSRFLSVAIANAVGCGDSKFSRDQLQAAMNNMRQGVIIADESGDVCYANYEAWSLARRKLGPEQTQEKLTEFVRQGKSESGDIAGFTSGHELDGRFCPVPGTSMRRILMLLDETPSPDFSQLKSILTDREMDVLRLVEKGQQNPDIAENLYLSVNTVKRHLDNIYKKFTVNSRTELIAKVYRLLGFLQ